MENIKYKPIKSGELSPQEMAVLGYMARGHTNPEIAKIMRLKGNTVERHVTSIYRKACNGNNLHPRVEVTIRYWMPGLRPINPGELSPKEVTVLGYIARGHTNAQIAAIMRLKVHTLEAHITNIYKKVCNGEGLIPRVEATIRYWLSEFS